MKLISFFVIALSLLVAKPILAEEALALNDPFHNESEAGVVISTGNSQVRAFNFKQTNTYEFSLNLFKFTGRFLGSTNKGVENARYLTLGLRYERLLVDKFSLFAAETYESDIFAGYDRRFNTDLGVKYIIVKTEETDWLGEAGFRHIAEQLSAGPTNNRGNTRVYTEVAHKFTHTLNAKFWAEYIQSLANGNDLLFNSEISMSMLLSEVFSVKIGYLFRYNNNPQPPASTNSDTTFTTALVAKF